MFFTNTIIGPDWVPPLGVDKDDHCTNKSEEDYDASKDIAEKFLVVAEVDRVQSVQDNTKVEMEVRNDHGQFLLDVVGERERVRGYHPCRIEAEWIDTFLMCMAGIIVARVTDTLVRHSWHLHSFNIRSIIFHIVA